MRLIPPLTRIVRAQKNSYTRAQADLRKKGILSSKNDFVVDVEAKIRLERARQLKGARERDRQEGWGRTYRATLGELIHQYYGLDIINEINKQRIMQPNFRVLEIGCGDGSAAIGLHAALGKKVKVFATGLTRDQKTFSKSNGASDIEWHIAHSANFLGVKKLINGKRRNVFHKSQFDFIHSNLGLGHSVDLRADLETVAVLLKKGGKLLFTKESVGHLEERQLPATLKFARAPWPSPVADNALQRERPIKVWVYYLEKK
jgi:SAM-dependent methyltransferase